MTQPGSNIIQLAPDASATFSQDIDVRRNDWKFEPAKLHDRSSESWAVIGQPSGAIAERGSGALLMRLPKSEACEIALRMTRKAAGR